MTNDLATIDTDTNPPEADVGKDGEAPVLVGTEGTPSQPEGTGDYDPAKSKAWTALVGEPEAELPSPVSQADEEYQALLDKYQTQRDASYSSVARFLITRAQAGARERGLEGDEAEEYIEKELRPHNTMHSSAEAHFASRYREAAARVLGPELAERFRARQYADPDSILKSFGQDIMAAKDEEWAKKIKGEYLTKDKVLEALRAAYNEGRAKGEEKTPLAASTEAIVGGSASNTTYKNQREAEALYLQGEITAEKLYRARAELPY